MQALFIFDKSPENPYTVPARCNFAVWAARFGGSRLTCGVGNA